MNAGIIYIYAVIFYLVIGFLFICYLEWEDYKDGVDITLRDVLFCIIIGPLLGFFVMISHFYDWLNFSSSLEKTIIKGKK